VNGRAAFEEGLRYWGFSSWRKNEYEVFACTGVLHSKRICVIWVYGVRMGTMSCEHGRAALVEGLRHWGLWGKNDHKVKRTSVLHSKRVCVIGGLRGKNGNGVFRCTGVLHSKKVWVIRV
jgi:hypothetical protein